MSGIISSDMQPTQVEITARFDKRPKLLSLTYIILNELIKGLLIQWSYKFNLVTDMIMLTFVFIGVTFFVGNGTLDAGQLASALLGYIAWFYATVAINDMAYDLREEAHSGTLEQWYMSPAPAGFVQIGRTLSKFVFTTATISVISAVLILIFKIHIPFRWVGLPVFGLMLVGVYGFGFIVGGATLLFKQIGSLANMVQNMILFLNGAFLPVDRFPDWLASVAQTLPTTQGIIVLRRVVLDGRSLIDVWLDGSLLWLLIHSGVYFAVGWIVFSVCERQAKKRGLLGQY
jgi:ABC-2 type transport system permease protein